MNCSVNCQLGENEQNWYEELKGHGELISAKSLPVEIGNDLVQQAVSLIDRHYNVEIEIAQIAKKLHVSPNYLSALFHKKTGSTFMKYLTQIRINKAKTLLVDSQIQVQQVAEQVGYCTTAYFTKRFTKTVGCSPSEYKKEMQSRKNSVDYSTIHSTSPSVI
jgi:two-component system response regulator YesN